MPHFVLIKPILIDSPLSSHEILRTHMTILHRTLSPLLPFLGSITPIALPGHSSRWLTQFWLCTVDTHHWYGLCQHSSHLSLDLAISEITRLCQQYNHTDRSCHDLAHAQESTQQLQRQLQQHLPCLSPFLETDAIIKHGSLHISLTLHDHNLSRYFVRSPLWSQQFHLPLPVSTGLTTQNHQAIHSSCSTSFLKRYYRTTMVVISICIAFCLVTGHYGSATIGLLSGIALTWWNFRQQIQALIQPIYKFFQWLLSPLFKRSSTQQIRPTPLIRPSLPPHSMILSKFSSLRSAPNCYPHWH